MAKAVSAVFVLLMMAMLAPAQAAPGGKNAAPPATGITAAQAQQALQLLEDPQKRRQLIDTLQTIVKAGQAAAPASHASPAAKAQVLLPGSLGEQLLARISNAVGRALHQAAAAASLLTQLPALGRALREMVVDPARRALMIDVGWRLVLVLCGARAAEWLLQRLLRRPLDGLDTRARARPPDGDGDASGTAGAPPPAHLPRARTILQRLPFAALRFFLEMIPVAVFGGVSVLLLGAGIEGTAATRFVVLAVVDAYLILRLATSVARTLVAPARRGLRLVFVSDAAAAAIVSWVRRIAAVAAFGGALAEAALALGMSRSGHDALVRLIGLAVALLLVAVVISARAAVAHALRSEQTVARGAAGLRDGLAAIWHYLIIFVLLAAWLIWAIDVRDGIARFLRFVAVTFAVLAAARLVSLVALAAVERRARAGQDAAGQAVPTRRYDALLRRLIALGITLLAALALLEVWGVGDLAWFATNEIGRRLAGAVITVAVAAAVALLIWEFANRAMERAIARLAGAGQAARAARLRTLLPFLRTSLLLTVLTVVGLTALSEIGVTIAPLLAGAGIVGIAVGFGSQKLVQDVITGLFLLLENAVQVGDWVTVGTLSGTVESLSIRTLWLRAGDGSVHVIPFSSVSSVTNTNRGLGNAAVSVNVRLTEDTDRVGRVLSEIAAGMRQEEAFKTMMLSEFQLWGVDKVDAAMVTIVGQIVCTASGRWAVQREFNRRMKKRFEELGIAIANPTQTIILAEPPTAAKPEAAG